MFYKIDKDFKRKIYKLIKCINTLPNSNLEKNT